jgi:AraC-like DNA-binding protein
MISKHSDATYAAANMVKKLIDANPFVRNTLTILTKDVEIGRNQLQDAFKEITGRTMKRYRLESRMKAASELLLAGGKVKDVAQKCRYKKYKNNFSRDFRSVYSFPPEQWTQHAVITSI